MSKNSLPDFFRNFLNNNLYLTSQILFVEYRRILRLNDFPGDMYFTVMYCIESYDVRDCRGLCLIMEDFSEYVF